MQICPKQHKKVQFSAHCIKLVEMYKCLVGKRFPKIESKSSLLIHKRFYTKETSMGIWISQLAKISTLYLDWLRSLILVICVVQKGREVLNIFIVLVVHKMPRDLLIYYEISIVGTMIKKFIQLGPKIRRKRSLCSFLYPHLFKILITI